MTAYTEYDIVVDAVPGPRGPVGEISQVTFDGLNTPTVYVLQRTDTDADIATGALNKANVVSGGWPGSHSILPTHVGDYRNFMLSTGLGNIIAGGGDNVIYAGTVNTIIGGAHHAISEFGGGFHNLIAGGSTGSIFGLETAPGSGVYDRIDYAAIVAGTLGSVHSINAGLFVGARNVIGAVSGAAVILGGRDHMIGDLVLRHGAGNAYIVGGATSRVGNLAQSADSGVVGGARVDVNGIRSVAINAVDSNLTGRHSILLGGVGVFNNRTEYVGDDTLHIATDHIHIYNAVTIEPSDATEVWVDSVGQLRLGPLPAAGSTPPGRWVTTHEYAENGFTEGSSHATVRYHFPTGITTANGDPFVKFRISGYTGGSSTTTDINTTITCFSRATGAIQRIQVNDDQTQGPGNGGAGVYRNAAGQLTAYYESSNFYAGFNCEVLTTAGAGTANGDNPAAVAVTASGVEL